MLATLTILYLAVAISVYLTSDVRPFPNLKERMAWVLFSALWPLEVALYALATAAAAILSRA
jgi:hypothetical protein